MAEENVGAIIGELAAVTRHEPPLPLAEAMARVVDLVEVRLAEPDSVGSRSQRCREALR